MSKPAVLRSDNRANLISISTLLEDIEHFIFYGTFLGLTRERDVIDGDDDIDILAPIEDRNIIIQRLKSIDYFEIKFEKKCNKSNFFLQVDSSINQRKSLIDFYFFENNPNDDFIVDRWNFLGKCASPELAMHIPKKYIYPIKYEEFFGQKIKLPSGGELLCEWLYGESWKIQRRKNISYVIQIIRNQPILIKPIPRKFERFIPKPLRSIIRRLINIKYFKLIT